MVHWTDINWIDCSIRKEYAITNLVVTSIVMLCELSPCDSQLTGKGHIPLLKKKITSREHNAVAVLESVWVKKINTIVLASSQQDMKLWSVCVPLSQKKRRTEWKRSLSPSGLVDRRVPEIQLILEHPVGGISQHTNKWTTPPKKKKNSTQHPLYTTSYLISHHHSCLSYLKMNAAALALI